MPRSAEPAGRTLRLRLSLAALLVVFVAGAVVLAWPRTAPPTESGSLPLPGRPEQEASTSSTVPELTTSSGPSLSIEEVPTTTGTTLPLPDPPPRDQYAPTPSISLGSITIPKLNVRVQMYEGITLTAVDRGSGHWPGTPQPGDLGNMVVAGHRTLHQRPFGRLDELKAGDKVIFTKTDGSESTYGVRGTIIVPANNIGVASQHSAHTATLFACHPKGQATHRIVTKLALLGSDGRFVDDEASLPPLDVGIRPNDGTLVVRDYGDDPNVQSLDPLAGAEQ